MMTRIITLLAVVFLSIVAFGCAKEESAPSKQQSIESIAAASERFDGFFTVFRKREDGSLHMLIRIDQLGQ